MCPTLFTSITREELLSVSWTGHTRLESDAPEYSWSLSRQRPRLTQEGSDSRLTGIIRIRLSLLLPGLPSAPGNSTLVALQTLRNSTMPGHFTMVEAGWTSIFHGSSLQASRSSTLR